jgi:nucleoside-diphosphate-sugar epimerase
VKRVLLTGATGFVGCAIARALDPNEYEVHGAARHTAAGQRTMTNVVMHEIDLLDSAAVAVLVETIQPTHLLMSAWTTNHGEYWTDPQNDRWVACTDALIRGFFFVGGKRAVLVGTCAEYDWTDPAMERGPIREDAAPGEPGTLYGRAKRCAGRILADRAAGANGSYAVARIFYPIGHGEDRRRLLPSLITALLAGRPADLGPGENVRDITDVRDVGDAIARLLDSDVSGPVNIGTGKGTRTAELASWVGRLVGRPDLIRIGVIPRRPGEPVSLVADVSRLTGELGFQPKHGAESAVAAAVHYWRAVGIDHQQRAEQS